GPQLAEEGDDPCHSTDDVMRGEGHYGMLYGILRSTHIFPAFAGNDLRVFLVKGQSYGPLFIKSHRIGIREGERRDIFATFVTPYRTLADTLDFRFRVFCTAVGAYTGDKRVAREPSFHRLVMAGSGGVGRHTD